MNRYPLPTSCQEEWADMEMGVIIHHCMETYHPEIPEDQWKKAGSLMPAESFAPTDENTDQWIGTAAKMGAKYAVLVANHCSGFSLWPTKENDYSMAKSPYRNGQADVVKDFVESCKKYGVRPGLYYSTGCNTHCGINDDEEIDYRSAHYQQYVGMVTRQLTELWSQYGEMFEIWFDGGVVPLETGGSDILGLLRKYQPNAICFQGPSGHPTNLRWVGNENGCAPIDCWSTAGTGSTGFADTSVDETGIGRPDGAYWIPAETDMASRKQSALGGGWFWQAGEDHLVYTAEELMDTYLTSVGRNSNLLLGMCIDQRGHFPERRTSGNFSALASSCAICIAIRPPVCAEPGCALHWSSNSPKASGIWSSPRTSIMASAFVAFMWRSTPERAGSRSSKRDPSVTSASCPSTGRYAAHGW